MQATRIGSRFRTLRVDLRSKQPHEIAAAYRHCRRVASSHYENFTVGSWLLPRRLRDHIAAVYAFARTADDLADEGSLDTIGRLAQLASFERSLEECFRGRADDPTFVALGNTAMEFDLPIEPFRDLLRAFRTDVDFKGFESRGDLLEYCRCSANPVGRIVLNLFGYRDAERQQLADCVCTGLQLANFWQDLSVDVGRGRVYVPRRDLAQHDCADLELRRLACTPGMRSLVEREVLWAETLLKQGRHLADLVEPRLGREVLLFAWGGLAILGAIRRLEYDVISRRPAVSATEKAALIWRALLARPGRAARREAPS